MMARVLGPFLTHSRYPNGLDLRYGGPMDAGVASRASGSSSSCTITRPRRHERVHRLRYQCLSPSRDGFTRYMPNSVTMEPRRVYLQQASGGQWPILQPRSGASEQPS